MDVMKRRDSCLPKSPLVTSGMVENTATSVLDQAQFATYVSDFVISSSLLR